MSIYIASSPHARIGKTTHQIMKEVILCLIPGILAQIYYFGWGNLIQIIWGVILCVTLEAAVLALRKQPIAFSLNDYSAAVTGVLLGIALPPFAPWWIMVIGAIFAIVIAKHIYGGLGHNIFNPAMIAYLVLLISFPVQMTSWMPVSTLQATQQSWQDSFLLIFTHFNTAGFTVSQVQEVVHHTLMSGPPSSLDALTGATPLDAIKSSGKLGIDIKELVASPVFTSLAGAGWQGVNIAFLLGGLLLLLRKTIMWYIPTAILISLIICATIGYLVNPQQYVGPIIHLLSGATMLGAFFIATDPVSAATTNKGRLIYGVLIGILIYLIRTLGNYPDAIAFSVVLANTCVPLIDYYTIPRAYGR